MRSQISAWRTKSTSGGNPWLLLLGSAMAFTLLGRRPISIDYLADELAADHVAAGEGNMGNCVDAFKNSDGIEQAGVLAVGQVDLRGVSGDDHLTSLAEP